MSTLKLATLGVLIPLALATPLMAQERGGPDRPPMVFETFDLNGDGAITLEEVQGAGAARFAAADTDGDGALSRDEMIAAGQGRVEARVDRMMARVDADRDGLLSQEELAEARDGRRGPNPERLFSRMDANDDGTVTEEEFQAAAERFMERRGHGHGQVRDRG